MHIEDYWYHDKLHPLLLPLLPLSFIFRLITGLRRLCYQFGIKKSYQFSQPLIVVGNITVGGTGKTPFVLWLVNYLKEQGKKPGIALRGVGGRKNYSPIHVTPTSNPLEVGDEAILLARNTYCPVVACIDRVAAVKQLIALQCDIIVCDDGLQHYRLCRNLEIAIIDGDRYFGNGFSLPTGPLREPLSRLNKVDFIMVNQHAAQALSDKPNPINDLPLLPMHLKMINFVPVHHPEQAVDLSTFANKKVHAIAGIGNPQRFFAMLNSLNIDFIPHIFPDHYIYQAQDLDFNDKLDILMTEKDAIKCQTLLLNKRLWYLRIQTEVSDDFKKTLLHRLSPLIMKNTELK